ncbi:MAG: hypothetical protein LBB74_05380 [Chitinispirillales bacterium]|jgi:hypothetical protein|nr:hypothetical protein [Chitinispirillales bacterium]
MPATAVTELREDIARFWVTFKETELARQESERVRELARQEWELAHERSRQEWELAHERSRREWELAHERSRRESELAHERSRRESERDLKLAREETERLRQETESIRQETELACKKAARIHEETEQAIQRLSDSVNFGLGGLRNSIGHIIEMVLLPGLSAKINALGHIFTKTSYGNEFKRRDGSSLAQVDLYLENGDEVMVVEAKTLFNERSVTDLLTRVQKLRDNEKLTGVAGKTIYAAAAGVNFTAEACRMIGEKGIYLVEVNEENDRISVKEISIDEAGKW